MHHLHKHGCVGVAVLHTFSGVGTSLGLGFVMLNGFVSVCVGGGGGG